jgi:hypothetical protein
VLAEAFGELRSAQGHTAQAAAARGAAEQLFAAHGQVTPPLRTRPASAAQQARLDAPALRLLPHRSLPPATVQPPRQAARSPRRRAARLTGDAASLARTTRWSRY